MIARPPRSAALRALDDQETPAQALHDALPALKEMALPARWAESFTFTASRFTAFGRSKFRAAGGQPGRRREPVRRNWRHRSLSPCALALLLCACAENEPAHIGDAGNAATIDASASADRDAGADAGTRDELDARADASAARDATPAPTDAATSDPQADASARDAEAGAPAGWKLVWSDEFEGAAGAKLDASCWVYEVGGTGWGNDQLEFDTDRAENAALDGSGELVITARRESYMGRAFTSARLKTQGNFEHGYGRYEARMRIPFGQGIWPAFWMLGADIGSAAWPSCGEIDIMENIGREPDIVHGTLHGPGYSGGASIGAPKQLAAGRFADAYHVFAIEWEPEVVRWYVDGELYQTRTPRDLPAGARWVYDHAFFILLNLAVGGQWPGAPDATTTFPQTLRVDYVRVYDRAD